MSGQNINLPDELAEKLFTGLAKEMLARLENGTVTASDMNVIRQFLRDNNITSTPQASGPLKGITEKMPFEDGAGADVRLPEDARTD